MKKVLPCLLACFMVYSCHKIDYKKDYSKPAPKEEARQEQSDQKEIIAMEEKPAEKQDIDWEKFAFSDYRIGKGKIGEIPLGMKLQKADSLIQGLASEHHDPFRYLFEGAGDAITYSFKGEPVFALMANKRGEITVLVAVHEKLKTINGLSPKSSVRELLKKYPDIKVYYNEFNESEEIYVDEGWNFVYGGDGFVGEYNDVPDATSKPINLDLVSHWLYIK